MTESERLKARIDALKKKLIALKEMNRGFGLMRVNGRHVPTDLGIRVKR